MQGVYKRRVAGYCCLDFGKLALNAFYVTDIGKAPQLDQRLLWGNLKPAKRESCELKAKVTRSQMAM